MHSGGPAPATASPGRAALLTAMTSASEFLSRQPGVAVALLSARILQLSCPFCRGKAGGSYSQRLGPQPPIQTRGTSLYLESDTAPTCSVPRAGRSALPWRDGDGAGYLTPAAPLRGKGVELRWVYTGTSNDQMYIEIYKDFYINLIKQILK